MTPRKALLLSLAFLICAFPAMAERKMPWRHQSVETGYNDPSQPVVDIAKELKKRKKEYEEIEAPAEGGASIRLSFPKDFDRKEIGRLLETFQSLYREAALYSGRNLRSNLVVHLLVIKEYPVNFRYASPIYHVPTYDAILFVKKGSPLFECETNRVVCVSAFFSIPHELVHDLTEDMFEHETGRWLEDGLCETFAGYFAKKYHEDFYRERMERKCSEETLQNAGREILDWEKAKVSRKEILKKTADEEEGAVLMKKLGGPDGYYAAAWRLVINLEACLKEKGKGISHLLNSLDACAPCSHEELKKIIRELTGRGMEALADGPCETPKQSFP